MELKINGKALIAISVLSAGIAFGEYVSVINAKSAGGVIVNDVIDTTPVGSVIMWTQNTPPSGWLEMNGQSTSGYPELANIVGSTVPDLRGQFVRAWDNGKGMDSGRSILSEQGDAIRDLQGSFTTYYSTSSTSGVLNGVSTTNNKSSLANGSGYKVGRVEFKASLTVPTADENRPNNVALMYIIKAE